MRNYAMISDQTVLVNRRCLLNNINYKCREMLSHKVSSSRVPYSRSSKKSWPILPECLSIYRAIVRRIASAVSVEMNGWGVFMVNEGGGIGVELIDAAIEAALDRLVGEQRNQLGVK